MATDESGQAGVRVDNRPMPDMIAPLTDAEMAELEQLLDKIPAPLEPLDLMMLDGYLCGVLLQPTRIPTAQWQGPVVDVDGRPLPARHDSTRLFALVGRRHAQLEQAIAERQWFDPWVFELDDDAEPLETVMPWVAGFATAMELFPQLMRQDSREVLEPLAVLYRAFDPEDLEDAEDMLEMIEMLEPPDDLGQAVEALVSSTLMLADVSRPRPTSTRPALRRPGPGGPRGGAGTRRGPAHAAGPRGGPKKR
jgi:uncharacterized protein